jgi:hypothetical protein
VSPFGAIMIGGIAGVVVVLSVDLMISSSGSVSTIP